MYFGYNECMKFGNWVAIIDDVSGIILSYDPTWIYIAE